MKKSGMKWIAVLCATWCAASTVVWGGSASWEKPDFIVTSVVLDPAAPAAGGAFTATVTVLNQGDISGDAGVVRMWVSKAGTAKAGAAGDAEQAAGTLAVGETRTLTFALIAPTKSGTHHARAFVDADNATPEKSEGNNQMSATYTLSAPPTWMKPDFTVDSLVLNPAAPAAGGAFTATVTVRNQGDIPGDGGLVRMWVSKAGTAKAGDAGDAEQAVGPLAVGETRTLSFALTAATKKGTHHARAYVDADDATPEKSEGNNQISSTYTLDHDAPALATVMLNSLAQVYDGTPKRVAVATEPAGLAVEITYDGSTEVPVGAGGYAVAATVVDERYQGSATGVLMVAKAQAVVVLTDLVQVYDGTPKAVLAETDPVGLPVEVLYAGEGALPGGPSVHGAAQPPVEAGIYSVAASAGDANHEGSASGTLVVAKAPALVTLNDLAQVYDGSPKSVTVATEPAGLAVEITYDGLAEAPVGAGGYAVAATVVEPNYEGSASGTLAVAKADQTIDFPAIGNQRVTNVLHLAATASSGLPVGFAVVSGPAVIDGATATFNATGFVSLAASQAGNENWNAATNGVRTFNVLNPPPIPQINKASVNVRENGQGRFFVRLAHAPNLNTSVIVSRTGGDAGLAVQNGAVLLFTPVNWSTWQAVTLAAAEDANANNETAAFQVYAPGGSNVYVQAVALDDDIGENLAPASRGTTLSGVAAVGMENVIDGIHTVGTNYGYTVWTNVPPGTMTMDLKGLWTVSRLRLLNYDWDVRANRYIVESSLNGTNWSMLADASGADRNGWDDWAVEASPVRYLRFTGLSNSTNRAVCIAEWEVVGAPYRAPAAVTLGDLTQVYDGLPRVATATTDPAGLAVEITYDGGSAAPTAAGSYAVTAAVVEAHYQGSAAGTLVVAKADQTIDFPEIGDQVKTNGLALAATASSGLTVNFAVASGPAAIVGTTLTFTGTGAVTIAASQAGDANWNPAPGVSRNFQVGNPASSVVVHKTGINVREGGEGRLFMRLGSAPETNVVVRVVRAEGDTNLWIKSGGTQTFTPANWNVWRIVTLAATEDANDVDETATFRISMPGRADRFVAAIALDDEIGENIALASHGSTIGGAGSILPSNLIDGVHTVGTNYGYTVWNVTPPGAMVLDLKDTSTVTRVRLLNADWSYRVHRYKIESSLDGASWTLLADASADDRCGWDDWAIEGSPMRYLRFTGLSNSANHAVCIAEWEVYGAPFVKAPAAVALGGLQQVYDGSPRVVSATTEPAGLAVAITYNGSAEAPVNAGAYAVVATVDAPFHAGSATGTLVVAKAPVTVTLGNLVQVYDGEPKEVAVETDPGDLPVAVVYEGGPVPAGGGDPGPPVDAGTYEVEATAGDANHEGFGGGTLEILPADQTIDFPEFFEVFSNDTLSLSATADSGLAVTYAVASGPATLAGTTLTFTGLGSVSLVASQAGDRNWNPATDVVRTFEVESPHPVPRFGKAAVNVREGGEGRVYMRLNMAPTSTVVVRMTRVAGDTNLWIKSGGVQTFTPANWNVWRVITLAANGDDNSADETAVFRVTMPGARDRTVTATALDDDLGENLALASAGAVISGNMASFAALTIDGVHTVSTNYGYTTWTNDPPGSMTLELPAMADVSRVRVLNFDWSYRVHRYRIESSQDGVAWSMLADASAGEHSGWEDWAGGAAPVRYLRFTGLSNSVNPAVCIAEWEVYGERAVWQQDQTVDFPAIGDKLATDLVGLTATASSGLPVSFAVAAGPAAISGGTNLSFTGTGTVSIAASQAGDADWHPAPVVVRTFNVTRPTLDLEFSKTQINVREGGEGRVFMRLSAPPAATVVTRISAAGGDPNIWIKSGGVQTFTPANWSVWRMVTLAANDDANDIYETAAFRATMPGAAERMLTATALDDDLGANLALATAGTLISGTTGSYLPLAIDGVHTANANYAYTVWTNDPPGTMTLDLTAAATVSRVRILNWDFSLRTHRYTLETSEDGAVWTMLADASAGEHSGWEDWAADGRTMRYLRFTGLSNSANSAVCIAEWEVYGVRAPAAKKGRSSREVRSDAAPVRIAAEASEPVMVLTSAGLEDETGWAAVDGDPDTAWVGHKASGGYLLVEYAPALELSALEVDTAEGSPADIQVLYSRDGEEWLPLPDDLEAHPVSLNFLWLVFPDDGSDAVPQVLEIRPLD